MLVACIVDPPLPPRDIYPTALPSVEVDGRPIVGFASKLDIRSAVMPSATTFGSPVVSNFGLRTTRVPSANTFGATTIARYGLAPHVLPSTTVVNPAIVLPARYLTQTRVASSTSFGANQVARYGLAPTRFQNVSTFGAPTIRRFGLDLTRVVNVSTVNPAAVLPTRYLSQNRFANASTFGATAIISAGEQEVGPTAVVNTSTVGYPALSLGLVQSVVTNTSTFGAQSVGPDLTQHHVTNASTFGNPSIAIVVAPSYSNVGGQGFRRDMIAVTWSGTSGAQPPDWLVDGSRTDNDFFWSNGIFGPYNMMFDFRSIGPQKITEATWYQSASDTHGIWKWQGSNDNSTWTDIGGSFTLGGSTTQVLSTLSGNTASYLYYRIIQVSGVTSWNPYLNEIEFKLVDGDEPAASVQSVLHPGGKGDRTSSITISTTATLGAGTINNIIDGGWGTNTTDAFWWTASQSSVVVLFDFGSKRIIDEAYWAQDRTDAHGTWKWQGSNDGTTFTDIGSTFTLGGAFRNRLSTLNGNVTPYRYYRLTQTAAGTAALPQNVEITFRIDNVSHP